MTLQEYFQDARGRMAVVAGKVGISVAFLSQISNGVRSVPAERGADIEQATDGAVRRWDLRPDDWHRIWPELIGAEGAPDVPQPAEVRDAA